MSPVLTQDPLKLEITVMRPHFRQFFLKNKISYIFKKRQACCRLGYIYFRFYMTEKKKPFYSLDHGHETPMNQTTKLIVS